MGVLNIAPAASHCPELPENIFQDDSAVQLNPQTTPEKKKSGMHNKKYEMYYIVCFELP